MEGQRWGWTGCGGAGGMLPSGRAGLSAGGSSCNEGPRLWRQLYGGRRLRSLAEAEELVESLEELVVSERHSYSQARSGSRVHSFLSSSRKSCEAVIRMAQRLFIPTKYGGDDDGTRTSGRPGEM